jgi:hypothetical protein
VNLVDLDLELPGIHLILLAPCIRDFVGQWGEGALDTPGPLNGSERSHKNHRSVNSYYEPTKNTYMFYLENLVLPSQAHMYMFRIAVNKLFEWLFSRVLTSHHTGPGSIPGREMSVSGPLD